MGKEVFNLVLEEELYKQELLYKIRTGTFTREEFNNMTPEQQDLFKQLLFEYYTGFIPDKKALSAVEFALVGLAKLFFKLIKGEPLTETEQTYYSWLESIFNMHDAPLDINSWQAQYITNILTATNTVRAEYLQRKLEWTGNL